MIKMIASDIDGTLVEEGTLNVNKELLDTIETLLNRGVQFVAASGRQYLSMSKVFEPFKDRIYYLAEGGTYIVGKGKEIARFGLSEKLIKKTLACFRSLPGEKLITISTPECTYSDSKDVERIRRIRDGYGLVIKQVPDLMEIDMEGAVKLAVCCEDDASLYVDDVRAQLGDQVDVMSAGSYWIDCIIKGANKGKSLKFLQNKLGITKEETMAFGDNGNDICMLDRAAYSYAVANARDEVKAAAKFQADRQENDGVLKVLKTLL